MKRFYLLILCIVLSACEPFSFPFNIQNDEEPTAPITSSENEDIKAMNWKQIDISQYGDGYYFSVPAFFNEIGETYHFNSIDKTLEMVINNNQYYMIYGVPVLHINGFFLPDDGYRLELTEETPWLPIQFITTALGLESRVHENSIEFYWEDSSGYEEAVVEEAVGLDGMETMTMLMSEFQSPIQGAMVDTISSHLPGARRDYRNGYHEGMDWYGFSSGVPINRQTEVYAMGNGVIVRADQEYNQYTSVKERNEDLQVAAKQEKTPEYILDRLRGRQVWVQYDNGMQARFCHLDRIPEQLAVGEQVSADTLIGYVGNSGTSGDVKNDDTELHLHLDLLYKGTLFWKGLNNEEIVQVMKSAFENEI